MPDDGGLAVMIFNSPVFSSPDDSGWAQDVKQL
jgi:hypothetical protein